MKRSFVQRLVEFVLRPLVRIAFILVYRVRCTGREHFPQRGGALVCANHQSVMDPVVVALACDRRMNFLARRTLFLGGLVNWFMDFWDAIPLHREGIGFGGIKESARRLNDGELLLMFPEGTRCHDGQVGRIRGGFCTIARRGNVPVIPVGFDGAFDAWPRRRSLPSFGVIHICIGEPISAEQIESFSDDDLIEELDRRIRRCFDQARAARLRWPRRLARDHSKRQRRA